MTDLERAKEMLSEGRYTCVLCLDDMTFTGTADGIKPLNWWLRDGCRFVGFSAADRVVGRAAAFLYVLLGVKEIYAGVLSESALDVLDRYGIKWSYGSMAKNILNRTGDDLCPMEKIALEHDDPDMAYIALKEKIAELMSVKKNLKERKE